MGQNPIPTSTTPYNDRNANIVLISCIERLCLLFVRHHSPRPMRFFGSILAQVNLMQLDILKSMFLV